MISNVNGKSYSEKSEDKVGSDFSSALQNQNIAFNRATATPQQIEMMDQMHRRDGGSLRLTYLPDQKNMYDALSDFSVPVTIDHFAEQFAGYIETGKELNNTPWDHFTTRNKAASIAEMLRLTPEYKFLFDEARERNTDIRRSELMEKDFHINMRAAELFLLELEHRGRLDEE
jgi:hypothetical protein